MNVQRLTFSNRYTMFYFLSKTIGYFLTPAGWLLGTLGAAWGWPRYRRRLVGVSLLLFWTLGNDYLVYYHMARLWEVSPNTQLTAPTAHDSTRNGELPPAVAVVLTGGMVNTKLTVAPDRPVLSDQGDRLGQAVFLYKTGRVQKILVSGGSSDLVLTGHEARQEGREALRFLRLTGVPARDLLWETQSRNTRENALFSANLLRERYKTDRCVVVTSAFHMRRAVGCFERAGIRATPFGAAYIQQVGQPGLADLLVPHERTFTDAMRLLKEWFGYVTYAAMGYL